MRRLLNVMYVRNKRIDFLKRFNAFFVKNNENITVLIIIAKKECLILVILTIT